MWRTGDCNTTWLGRVRTLYPRLVLATTLYPRLVLATTLYPRLVLATTLYRAVMVHLMDVVVNPREPLAVCESVILTFFTFMTFVKGGTLLFQAESFAQLIADLEKLHSRDQVCDKNQRKVLLRVQRYSNGFVKYFAAFGTFMATLATVMQLIDVYPKRTLQDRGWFPFDLKPSPVYELTLACYSCTMVWIVNIVSVCDTVIMSLFIHIIGQLQILRYKLTNIRKYAKKKIQDERKQCNVNQNRVRKYDTEMLSQNIARVHETKSPRVESRPRGYVGRVAQHANIQPESNRVAARNTVHRPGRSNANQLTREGGPTNKTSSTVASRLSCPTCRCDRSNSLDRAMQRVLRECVIHHNRIIRCIQDFERIFNPSFMVQLVCNLIPTAVFVLFFTMSEKFDNKNQAFSQLLGACLMQLFCFCWFSTRITQESEEVREAIFDCEWLEASGNFKKDMRIMMSRANAPVVIKAASYVPLTLEVFLRVTQSAYSYYVAVNVYLTKNLYDDNNSDIALFASASYDRRGY